MRKRIGSVLGALALTAVLAAAKDFTRPEAPAWCQRTAGATPAVGAGAAQSNRAAFISASMSCMSTMQDSMRTALMSPVGGTDAVFAAAMTAHHEGALGMAEAELRYGTDPELRRMAQGMVASQGRQVEQMRLARARLLSSRAAHVPPGPAPR